MRIIAGEWRGRLIKAPKGDHVRPTRDRVREAWMNIVRLHLPGARVADLCAGSGALGLEALSRGAAHADFVETDTRSLALIKENVTLLGAQPRSGIHRIDAVKFVAPLPERSFDVVFADPPYATEIATKLAERWLEVQYADLLCIEHDSRAPMPKGGEARRYGTSTITFYHADSRHLRG
jgi:16S rRNA (guanine966-N2)-methyltransferase